MLSIKLLKVLGVVAGGLVGYKVLTAKASPGPRRRPGPDPRSNNSPGDTLPGGSSGGGSNSGVNDGSLTSGVLALGTQTVTNAGGSDTTTPNSTVQSMPAPVDPTITAATVQRTGGAPTSVGPVSAAVAKPLWSLAGKFQR